MAATRLFASPPYTGPSADVEHDAVITRTAGYMRDRDAILSLAVAAYTSPDDMNSTAVSRLAEAVETLDTLVVARDNERSADRRTIDRLERDLAAAVAIRAAAHDELSATRDQLLAQTHTIEQLRLDLAIAEHLRTAALADANDQRNAAIVACSDNRTLRGQNAALAIAMLRASIGVEDLAHDVAIADLADREHARAAVTQVMRHRSMLGSYERDKFVMDVSSTEVTL